MEKKIKTWKERCSEFSGGVSSKMIQDAMRAHIKDLLTEIGKLNRSKRATHKKLLEANASIRKYQKQLASNASIVIRNKE